MIDNTVFAPGSPPAAAQKIMDAAGATRENRWKEPAARPAAPRRKATRAPTLDASKAAAPPLRPALNFSVVVTADDAIGSCYRNPVLVQTHTGALLCFIEERSRGQGWKPGSGSHACPDNYGVGAAARGGHNLGYFRSTDLGKPAALFVLQLP
jgi:hypothetical protein